MGDHFDQDSQANESPVQPVSLEPFFLSKYEMTQAQWERLSASNPSLYNAKNHAEERSVDRTNGHVPSSGRASELGSLQRRRSLDSA